MDKEEADLLHALTAQVESLQAKVEELEANPLYNPIISLHQEYSKYKTKVDELEDALKEVARLTAPGGFPSYKYLNKIVIAALKQEVSDATED